MEEYFAAIARSWLELPLFARAHWGPKGNKNA
jgi:hypothetical protein